MKYYCDKIHDYIEMSIGDIVCRECGDVLNLNDIEDKFREEKQAEMREFESGATRNVDEDRVDPEGFFSPLVFERYMQYMHKHRKQADGKLRASDNWQKGIPLDAYMKSKWRHFFESWRLHRAAQDHQNEMEESLCAELFNTMGFLHEILKGKK